MRRAADVRHLLGHVVRICLHDPLVRGAENGRAEVVDRSIDVDVGSHGPVDDAVSESRLDLGRRSLEPHPDARTCKGDVASAASNVNNEYRQKQFAVLGVDLPIRSKWASTCCMPLVPGSGSGLRCFTYS